MKLKKRLLSGALALTMLAGSFFINSGQANAEDPAPWVPSPADEAFAVAAPADWAFDVTSVPLHNAILAKYDADFGGTGDVDANDDGYISISEATAYTGRLIFVDQSIGGTLEGITHFVNIDWINLINNEITGELPQNIDSLNKLIHLQISKNKLIGNIPDTIGALPNLVDLYLDNNQLSGNIPNTIGSLSNLGALALYNNKLTGEIPENIGGLIKLEILAISGNLLEGSLPASFQNLTLVSNFSFSGNNLGMNDVEGTDVKLIDSLTQEKIDLATADLANFPPNAISISSFQAKIDHAQSLLDLRIDAEDQVGTLLTTAGDALNAGITQAEITAAQTAVDLLPDGSTVKADLQAKIDLAQQMLDATAHVDALLTANGANLTSGVTQTSIDNAQTEVTALPDGTLKDELQAKLDTAQNLLDAEGLVGALLVDGKTALGTSVTQGAITAAQTAVTALPEGTTKTNLQADIDLAQAMLDAKTHVDALLTADGVNLASGVTQGNIDSAQIEVTDLPDGALKDDLQAKIDTAQSLLDAKTLADAKDAAKADLDQKATDAKNAIEALPNLTPGEKAIEKSKVDADLADAKTAVDAAGDTTAVNNAKNTGNTDIAKDLTDAIALDAANLADAKTAAKAELEAKAIAVKDAIDALTGLSTAEKTAAKDGINAELTRGSNAIDAATTITKVTEEKITSIANMDKILKDAKALDAKNAVNDLFDDTGKIKDPVNQDVINSAKEKVNGLDPGTEKDQLEALIAEAQKQLDARNYVAPVSDKPFNSGTSTKTIGNVNTGDYSSNPIYLIVLLSAMIGLVFIIKRKIQKQS